MQSDTDLEIRALALFERALQQPEDQQINFIQISAGFDRRLKERTLNLLAIDKTSRAKILTGNALVEGNFTDYAGTKIGSYQITDLIGQGGMGAVYRAERISGDFTHDVAIKLVRPGVMADELAERFQRERQTLADICQAI